MDRFIRVTLAIIAISLSSTVNAIPKQSFISEKDLDPNELDRVKTIALLEVPDPPYYFFGEGIGAATGLFGIIGFVGELSQYGKNSDEYGEFSFGKTSQAFLKQFLEENGYKVIEHKVDRKNKYGLVKDYANLDIKDVDAYLDFAPVEVGYKQDESNVFNDSRTGPHVSAVVRLVSAKTNKIIYAGSIQYGWDMNSFASGIKIDSPEDHKYETKEELKAQKEQAIKRLVRGIEAVSFNIARQITNGEFVSTMSPTMEDVTSESGNQESIEFVSTAATEVALKTYDEKLWQQSGELAGGDAQKQAEFYITLRSKRLAEEERREKFQQIAKLASQNTGSPPVNYEVSGTYISNIKGPGYSSFPRKYKRAKVTIIQNGNKIKGSFGSNGEIEGVLENDTIVFDWYSPNFEGTGKWKIGGDGMGMTGKWQHSQSGQNGEWNLTKSDSSPIIKLETTTLGSSVTSQSANYFDLTGTYVSDITTNSLWRFKKAEDRRLKITISQNGNKITGTNKSKNLKINGVIEGDEITFFTWPSDISSDEIKGKWKIHSDGIRLTGKWSHPHGGGKWNLTRVE